MGLIEKVMVHLGLRVRKVEPRQDPPPPPREPPLPTLEVFAQAGHGKSSFLWAVLYMLRKLNLVWPEFLCWPQQPDTESALRRIHEHLHASRLPERGSETDPLRYSLLLDHMERWGQKHLRVWDAMDPVFSPGSNGSRSEPINWRVPACWLISLSDLDRVQVEILDMLLVDLVSARRQQGFSAQPFKLIVTLTKGDAISDLPLPLRAYLKEDPLWKAVNAEASLLSARASHLEQPPLLGEDALRGYLGTLWRAHEAIQHWMEGTLGGHMLVRRATELHVDLRFAIISATGSGIGNGVGLQVPWSPRRVLDPLFWAFELEASRLR